MRVRYTNRFKKVECKCVRILESSLYVDGGGLLLSVCVVPLSELLLNSSGVFVILLDIVSPRRSFCIRFCKPKSLSLSVCELYILVIVFVVIWSLLVFPRFLIKVKASSCNPSISSSVSSIRDIVCR